MSKRNRKRIALKAEAELAETVRSFLLSVPQGCSPKVAQHKYDAHNERWRDYCEKMNHRHPWLNADAEAFANRVTLLNQHAEKKLKPLQYYGKRIVPALVIGALTLLLTDMVLPYFSITDYKLFN